MRSNTFRKHLLATACAGAILVPAAMASATTLDWTGPTGTITDPLGGNFNVATNWFQNQVPPSANDTVLNFQSGTASYDANNDIANLTINRINHSDGDGTSQVRITGNALTFDGAGAGIYYSGSDNFFIRTGLSTADPNGTLVLNSTQTNNNFKINDGNAAGSNSIQVGTLQIEGGRVVIRGTQNEIGQINLGNGAQLSTDGGQVFSTTAVINFAADSEIRRNNGAVNFTSGGWQSDTPGAGSMNQTSSAGAGGNFIANVAAGETYTFSGNIGEFGGTPARTSIIKTGDGTQILTTVTPGNAVMRSEGRSGNQIQVNAGLLHLLAGAEVQGTGASNHTTISGSGEFRVDGVLRNSSTMEVRVDNGGTLSGSGTINRQVFVNDGGTISPGASIGNLTMNQVNWLGGGTYVWELQDTSLAAGTGWDLLSVNGPIAISASAGDEFTIALNSLDGGGNSGNVVNFDANNDYLFTIAQAASVAGFADDAFTLDLSNFTNPLGSGGWFIGLNDDQNAVQLAFASDNVNPFTPPPPPDPLLVATWTGGGAPNDPLTGIWSAGTSWDPAPGQPIDGDQTHVIFGGDGDSTAYTSTLDMGDPGDTFTLNRISIDYNGTGTSILDASGGRSLSLQGTNPTISFDGSSDFRITTDVSMGAGAALTGTGTGTLEYESGTFTADTLTKDGPFNVLVQSGGFLDVNHLIINGGRVGINNNASGNGINAAAVVEVWGTASFGQQGGGFDMTIGGLVGDGLVSNLSNQTRWVRINVADGERHEFTGRIDSGNNRVDEIQIRGAGVQAFGDGANTTRDVFVQGTLELSGVLTGSSGTTTIEDGGTLTGSGTWLRNFVFEDGSTVTPGSSAGTLTTGSQLYEDGTHTVNWNWDDGVGSKLVIEGDLEFALNAFMNLNLFNLGGEGPGDGPLALYEVTGSIFGFNADNWTINPGDSGFLPTASLFQEGNTIFLSNLQSTVDTTVIPEPTSAVLGLAGLGMLTLIRRRRAA